MFLYTADRPRSAGLHSLWLSVLRTAKAMLNNPRIANDSTNYSPTETSKTPTTVTAAWHSTPRPNQPASEFLFDRGDCLSAQPRPTRRNRRLPRSRCRRPPGELAAPPRGCGELLAGGPTLRRDRGREVPPRRAARRPAIWPRMSRDRRPRHPAPEFRARSRPFRL